MAINRVEVPYLAVLSAVTVAGVLGLEATKSVVQNALSTFSAPTSAACIRNENGGFTVCRINDADYQLTVNGINLFRRSEYAANGANFLHSTCNGRLERSWLPVGPIGTFTTTPDCQLPGLA